MTDHDYAADLTEMFYEEFGLHQIGRKHERPYLSLHLINGEIVVALPVSMTPKVTHLRAENGDNFLIPTRAIVYYRWVDEVGREPIRRGHCPKCHHNYDVF